MKDDARVAILEPTLSDAEFAERLSRFHRAVYASEPFVFDEVMTSFFQPAPGCVAHDHCLLRHEDRWHLYVLSNELKLCEPLVNAVRIGDWQAAQQAPFAIGDMHAVGDQLRKLIPVGKVLDPPPVDDACASTNTFVHGYEGKWVNLFCLSRPSGQSLGLAWSNDLFNWRYDDTNPVWQPPAWAGGTSVCKGPCIVEHEGTYFVFYNVNMAEGTSTVSLISTHDFHTFKDHGPVLKFPCQLRGTQGCESPCVFIRDGIWHLMVASGDCWWHTISNRPDGFMGAQGVQSATVRGVYDMGPFHVGKVVQHAGRWFMTSSYKAEHRRRCRKLGKPIFRGENDDEAGLLAGLFVCEICWEGDRPVLTKSGSLP